jgi:hypothetical protein
MNYREWFRQFWPFAAGRAAALAGYRALGAQHKHTLTDIALRNYVFHPAPPAADLHAAGVAEGRRQCALEIFKLAHINHDQLWALVEKKPEGNRA